jgi:hypothetical protein
VIVGRPPWHAAIGPATAILDWGDGKHRISWRRGKLVLDDHPDLGAEQAYVALGGDRCPCLDVLEAWDEWRQDPRVLATWGDPANAPFEPLTPPMQAGWQGGRSPGNVLAALRARQRATQSATFSAMSSPPPPGGPGPPNPGAVHMQVRAGGRSAHAAGPHPMTAEQRAEIRRQMEERHRVMWRDALRWALPEELVERLALSAAAGAVRRQAEQDVWSRWGGWVERAVSVRAAPAIEANRASVTAETWITRPGEVPALYGLIDGAGGWAAASVPGRWLFDVWAHGLALVSGCFVLDVTDWSEHPHRVRVLAARWERHLPAGSTPVVEEAIAVRSDETSWALRWA